MKRIIIYIYLLCNAFSLFGQYSTVTINTPNATDIEALQLTGSDFSASEKSYWAQYIQTYYPNAVILSDATKSYNCHGYAWNKSEGGGTYWINATKSGGAANLANYWTDGSYMEVCSVNEGPKIYYYSGDHSAVKSSVSGKYESKWGNLPFVRHDPTYVPSSYNGSYRRYYKKMNWNITAGGTCGSTIAYSVSSLSGASYSWSSSSALSGSSTTNNCYFTKLNNGSGWVQVNVSYSGCSGKSSRLYTTVTGIIGGDVYQSGQPNKVMQSTMSIAPNIQATIDLSYLPSTSSISVTKLYGTGTWSYNSSLKRLLLTMPTSSNISFQMNGSGNTCGSISRNVTFYTTGSMVANDVVDIYPNPAQYEVRVNLPVSMGASLCTNCDAELSVYDGSFRTIKTMKSRVVNGAIKLDVADLTPGFYFVSVRNGTEVYTGKFVKQ